MMNRKRGEPEVVGGKPEFKLPKLPLRGILLPILAVILIVWVVFGGPSYTVAPGEEALVLTFGKYTRTTEPGFHLKMPWPIQTVEKADIGEVKRIEIGFRSDPSSGENVYTTFTVDRSLLSEAQMITGDENVVDCSMTVQYRITDSRAYLFNFERGDVANMLQAIAEAALRQAVGDHPINDVLTTGKYQIMGEVKAKMQELADLTGAGVTITDVYLQDVQPPAQVADAFRDVASAREEREKIINEARAYQSEQIPKAEGEAQRNLQQAEGYKEARIAEAQGSVARFQAIAKQYALAPEITRSRLYLETMSELLPKVNLTIVDDQAGIVNLRTMGENGLVLLPNESTSNQGGSE
ncbi:MAG: FtsH protease activity modulator HflK [Candidatus Hydrogenedentes bacterium]|nr:FtsH protease activity modulator HflK [Candidatus Hydrogenedentota bacterium]